MTDIQTILLSQLNRHLVGSEMAKDIDDVLVDRFGAAKQEYRSIPKDELDGDVEEKRVELLNRISMLQSQTFFKVSKDDALTKMIPNLLIPYLIDQGAAAYEARSLQDLTMLDHNLQQFQKVLDQAIKRSHGSQSSRRYGVLGTTLGLIGTVALVVWAHRSGLDMNWTIPIFSVPVPILLWSLVGSLAAMFYRFNTASETEDPLRLLLTRPVFGVGMGMIVYFLISSFLVPEIAALSLGTHKAMWVVAFLAGFSDRFIDFTFKLIVGSLGHLSKTPDDQAAEAQGGDGARRTMELLEEMSWGRHSIPDRAGMPGRRRAPSERAAHGAGSRASASAGEGDGAAGVAPLVDDPRTRGGTDAPQN